MRPNICRAFATIFCALITVSTLNACAFSDTDRSTSTTAAAVLSGATSSTAPEKVEIMQENYPGSLPDGLCFDGRTFTMLFAVTVPAGMSLLPMC